MKVATPWTSSGVTRAAHNTTDGIDNSLSATDESALTLRTIATSNGHAGIINLGVKVG